jgi:hypothetical protein
MLKYHVKILLELSTIQAMKKNQNIIYSHDSLDKCFKLILEMLTSRE